VVVELDLKRRESNRCGGRVVEGVLNSPELGEPSRLLVLGEDSKHLGNRFVGPFDLSIGVLVESGSHDDVRSDLAVESVPEA
jgi:hypothetical protein